MWMSGREKRRKARDARRELKELRREQAVAPTPEPSPETLPSLQAL
jgi:hypothetical protein